MLKMWIGDPSKRLFKTRVVNNPDRYWELHVRDLEFMNTDFSKRVAMECSAIAEFLSCVTLKMDSGRLISPMQLSSGAKNVLLMKYFDCSCDMKQFVEEIAEEKDLYIYTTRDYVPYLESGNEPKPFIVLNNNKV